MFPLSRVSHWGYKSRISYILNSEKMSVKLGLRYNVIQAPMAGVSSSALSAAITRSGGLGSIAMAVHDLTQGVSTMEKAIDEFSSLVPSELKRNVNFNFFCHDLTEQAHAPTEIQKTNWKALYSHGFEQQIELVGFKKSNISFREIELNYPTLYSRVIELILQYRPKVVSFHFGIPSRKTIETLQLNGIDVFVCVTSVEDAKLALEAGSKGLFCQGYEAGGHRGLFSFSKFDEKLSTRALVKLVLQKFPDAFVVAAGGIMDSLDVKSYFALGALAVLLGTAFIDTQESLTKGYVSKEAAKDLPAPTTMVGFVSGKVARCIRTPFIERLEGNFRDQDLPAYGYAYSAYKEIAAARKDPQFGFHLVGQGYRSIVGNGKSAEEVFQSLVEGYNGPTK